MAFVQCVIASRDISNDVTIVTSHFVLIVMVMPPGTNLPFVMYATRGVVQFVHNLMMLIRRLDVIVGINIVQAVVANVNIALLARQLLKLTVGNVSHCTFQRLWPDTKHS